jgi:L-lactate dehydrogenase
MKTAIVGIGHVGSTLAFTLVEKGLCNHLLLANRNLTRAQGEALDLQHTLPFCARGMQIEACPVEGVADCDLVVLTLSATTQGKLSNRLQLAEANIKLFKQVIPDLATRNPACIMLIVSNPVDILTYYVNRITPLPASRIIGIGTLIDSARFRALLSAEEKIHPADLRAYILGEHGPNQFPVFSHASAGGELIADNSAHRNIFNEVSDAGFDVYHLKGYTNFAIASATCEVIQSIVYDDHRTMPLSTYFDEWLGIRDNCFSIPVVLGKKGIIRHLYPDLNSTEKQALKKTATHMHKCFQQFLGSKER